MMMAREHPRPDEDTDWQTQAACRGLDPDLFHPHTLAWYGPNRQRSKIELRQIAQAKAICATCPVGPECEADHPYDTQSIRNGKLPEERSQNPTRSGGRPSCGTDAGYRAHYRRGDRGFDVCQPCKDAHSTAVIDWAERRQGRAS